MTITTAEYRGHRVVVVRRDEARQIAFVSVLRTGDTLAVPEHELRDLRTETLLGSGT